MNEYFYTSYNEEKSERGSSSNSYDMHAIYDIVCILHDLFDSQKEMIRSLTVSSDLWSLYNSSNCMLCFSFFVQLHSVLLMSLQLTLLHLVCNYLTRNPHFLFSQPSHSILKPRFSSQLLPWSFGQPISVLVYA